MKAKQKSTKSTANCWQKCWKRVVSNVFSVSRSIATTIKARNGRTNVTRRNPWPRSRKIAATTGLGSRQGSWNQDWPQADHTHKREIGTVDASPSLSWLLDREKQNAFFVGGSRPTLAVEKFICFSVTCSGTSKYLATTRLLIEYCSYYYWSS